MSVVTEVVLYICKQCGAKDELIVEPGEYEVPHFNCNKCRAGQGKDTGQAIANNLGMFPVRRTPR